MFKRLMILLITFSLASCANTFSEQHFEKDHAATTKALENVNINGRATVYFLREDVYWFLNITAQPPFFYGIDNRLVSIMPVGSYVALSLEPGKHKFSVLVTDPFYGVLQKDVEADIQAEKIYYIGTDFVNYNSLRTIDTTSGHKTISGIKQAKLIHNPVTIDTFKSRLSQKNNSALSPADILPTSEQVTSFLEGIAAVALVALMIYGAAASTPPPSTPHFSQNISYSPPAVVRNIDLNSTVYVKPNTPTTIQADNESLSEIVQSEKRLEVRNMATGTMYTVEDGRISGSDGSRYRVIGSQIISNSGQTYTVAGNNLYTTDGHACTKTGSSINCK